MNEQNVRSILLKLENRTLTYEVVYMLRNNDMRDYSIIGDKRISKTLAGDGWKDETDNREVLNESVDSFIKATRKKR